ncbi:hypothetical protein [Nocardia donostiensis]|uniref:hypothetical protein n=1 Tax=Nocardia donostiensis TaxID=1538463 RepID=UPI00158D0D66|nr:hypothetical protein [Nocardia donostiensis]
MNTIATTAQINRWWLQKCGDNRLPESLAEARYLLAAHAGHGGCERYLHSLSYAATVM